MNNFNWDKSFLVDFDLEHGLSKTAASTKRYLSNMKNVFADQEEAKKILASEDPVIYEFYRVRLSGKVRRPFVWYNDYLSREGRI